MRSPSYLFTDNILRKKKKKGVGIFETLMLPDPTSLERLQ